MLVENSLGTFNEAPLDDVMIMDNEGIEEEEDEDETEESDDE